MHVLLVDDDEATRFLIRRALEKRPVRVSEAASVPEAMGILKAHRVDVILSDYRMPGQTGVDLLCHAQEAQPHAKRVLMSGTLQEDILKLAGGAACAHFIFEKPDRREAWHDLLKVALGAPPQPQEAEET